MKDRTVAIGALAVAGFSVVAGLMVGAVGGAFGTSTRPVEAPPLIQVGLQQASVPQVESASRIIVPPSPTWEVATPTTPRPQTTTTPPPAPATPEPTESEPTSNSSAPTSSAEPDATLLATDDEESAVTVTPSAEAADDEDDGEQAATTSAPTITVPPITTRPGNG